MFIWFKNVYVKILIMYERCSFKRDDCGVNRNFLEFIFLDLFKIFV